jgi:hypothetical protein
MTKHTVHTIQQPTQEFLAHFDRRLFKMRSCGYLALLWLAGAAHGAEPAAPPTLHNLDRKVRFISLAEARAIALEQGTVGQPSLLFPGVGLDNLVTAPQGKSISPGHVHVVCKPGSKSLIFTRVAPEIQPAELKRIINQMLLNVEISYWNLYGSYWQLYSREQALRFAYETWKITEAQYKVGRVSRAAVAQAEGQYNIFRGQRLAAIDTVLDNERQLRAMTGMKIKDGTQLVPSDAPTLVEKKPDWKKGLHSTMKNRPELEMARQDVKLAGWEAAVTEELAEYIPVSDGVRKAKLQLARASLVLQDQELKAERYLALWYRRMSSAYSQIKAARAQREAFGTQLTIRYELYKAGANEPGTGNPVTLNLLLETQRYWAEALATEYQAIVTYNNALVGWEFAKGDIIKHAHVRLAENAPDDSDVVSAVQREHKRTRQHVRHELAQKADEPENDKKTAPSLPGLWKSCPPLKDAGDVQTGLVKGRRID